MQAFFPLPVEFLDGGAVATLPAEIDIANAPGVTDVLLAVLNSAAGVIADVSRTRFCDAADVRAVVRASARAHSLGTWLRVVIGQPGVRKVFALTGADTVVRVYPTLAAAVDAGEGAGAADAGRDPALPVRPGWKPASASPTVEAGSCRQPGHPGEAV